MVRVNAVGDTLMMSEGLHLEESHVKSGPQRELLNDKLYKSLRQQEARTKCMLICLIVLISLCISSVGVLAWYINRTADALSKLQISVEQRGDNDATAEDFFSLQSKSIMTREPLQMMCLAYNDKLNVVLSEGIEEIYNKTDMSDRKMMDFILEVVDRNRMAQDCQDLLRYGFTTSGMYHIYPPGGQQAGNDVWCDMQTDGGGWIVIQRRQGGTVDFFRDWRSYKYGFGEPAEEFWIGNDVLHRLTSCNDVHLRVDLWSWENETAYAKYSSFTIGDEDSNYALKIGSFTGGNASDAMAYQNGMSFSTFDRNNGVTMFRHCAVVFRGAWWYRSCHHSNLNGPYSMNFSIPHALGIVWKQWKGLQYSLMKTEMKLRRA